MTNEHKNKVEIVLATLAFMLMVGQMAFEIYAFSSTNKIINDVENNKNIIQNIEIHNNIIHIHQ